MSVSSSKHVSHEEHELTLISNNKKPEANSNKLCSYNLGKIALDNPADKLLATFVNQMVASAFELPAQQLLKVNRGNARSTRARQISIYLMHTFLSFSLMKIARIYHKDRTTVGYACRVIEDLRDSPAFDDRMLELEETVKTVLKLAAYVPQRGKLDNEQ